MNFISYSFAVLMAFVMLCRLTIGRRKTERGYVAVLLSASVLFYAWHVPSFLFILLSSAVVDFCAGILLGAEASAPGRGLSRIRLPNWVDRRLLLTASLCVNLGLLFAFKYTDFMVLNVRVVLDACGIPSRLHAYGLLLPMGISFYTFASLSYTIDVYRRELRPVHQFWRFFLFVSFFPHLVAGPIVRGSMFLPQMDRTRRLRLRVFTQAMFLIIRGFFLKMVVADNLARYVNRFWESGYSRGADSGLLLLLSILFACQIFCDFEGYTSIAQGTAYLLGYRLPRNFNNPYIAGSFKNFWERWHISLSQWLRDYLYIPLGGNRGGAVRTYVNLMLVMLLGGIWHGAAWTFAAWGAVHGAALCLERALGLNRLSRSRGHVILGLAWYPVVQATILVTWVLFRSDGLANAASFLGNIAAGRFSGLPPKPVQWVPFIGVVGLMHLRGWLVERGLLPSCGTNEKAILAALMLLGTFLLYGESNAFVYFQF